MGYYERCGLGAGDLGVRIRAACAISDSDVHGPCYESPRGFRARSSRRMGFVRGNNCDCNRGRAARSVVRGPSVQRAFERLGEYHWRARACVTDESSLVDLVRLLSVANTVFDLDEHQNSRRRALATASRLRSRPTDLRPSRCNVFLTVWQARWGYFFVLIFALALPALLAPIKSAVAVWIVVGLSLFPILRDWDERLWPKEAELAKRMEKRIESAQIRDLSLTLRSPEVHPFLAPWWLSPPIGYWSGQPGVAGSSHESLNGIEDSARFFLSQNLQRAREILEKRHVAWVFAYDSDRVAQNSAAILNEPSPLQPLCRVLDRTPSQAPTFLIFSVQNPTCKLYGVAVGQ